MATQAANMAWERGCPVRRFRTTNTANQDHSKWDMQYTFASTQEIRNGAMEQLLNAGAILGVAKRVTWPT